MILTKGFVCFQFYKVKMLSILIFALQSGYPGNAVIRPMLSIAWIHVKLCCFRGIPLWKTHKKIYVLRLDEQAGKPKFNITVKESASQKDFPLKISGGIGTRVVKCPERFPRKPEFRRDPPRFVRFVFHFVLDLIAPPS